MDKREKLNDILVHLDVQVGPQVQMIELVLWNPWMANAQKLSMLDAPRCLSCDHVS